APGKIPLLRANGSRPPSHPVRRGAMRPPEGKGRRRCRSFHGRPIRWRGAWPLTAFPAKMRILFPVYRNPSGDEKSLFSVFAPFKPVSVFLLYYVLFPPFYLPVRPATSVLSAFLKEGCRRAQGCRV